MFFAGAAIIWFAGGICHRRASILVRQHYNL
jgi:hypothetical protein